MILIQMKIQVPLRRPYLLRRQRLIDFFLEHQKQKLLLLCAPAGYGKSTLVIDYVSEIAPQVCWYSLDKTDRDPVVFLRYLTECIRQRFPEFGEHSKQVLEVVDSGGDARTLREQPSDILDIRLSEIVDVMLNELYRIIDRFTIVLCDYHIVESRHINTLMLKLLQYLPENGQIIVLSRETPALALPRMAAYQEIAELKTKDLRFTEEEARMFLSGYPGKSFSEQVINTLVQRFDGWIAGIILGIQALEQQSVAHLGSYEDDNSQIFNYLAMEVLEQQQEDVQRFMLETSLLPRLSAPLCNALLERKNSLDLLRLIEKKGLFVDRLDIENAETALAKCGPGSTNKMDWAGKDAGVSWYYYHDLFRNFLRGRLHALEPERMYLLSLRAAELLLADDELEEVLPVSVEADKVEVSNAHQPEVQSHRSSLFRIFTLGELRVYKGETLIAQWRSAKARELLLYFIDCNSPQRKEVVMDALWPEVLLPQADWLFRSTLYRLRQVIGQGCIVYRRNLYELNLEYWFDVREFEAVLDEAKQLEVNAAQTHSAMLPELLAGYKRAISLYGGGHCETLYADWCSQRREELRQRYIEASLRLAHIEWDMNNMEESAKSWRRLLKIDECLEEAHQGLMMYYVTHGQRVMAVRQYQLCFQALKDLGMSPLTKTTSIYQSALSQKVKLDAI